MTQNKGGTSGLWSDGISHVVGRDELDKDRQTQFSKVYATALSESRAFPRNVSEDTRRALIGKDQAIVHAKDAEQFYAAFSDWVTSRIRAGEFLGLYHIKGIKTRTSRKFADEITVGFSESVDYDRFEHDILLPAKLAG
jgi:hypothetical protein